MKYLAICLVFSAIAGADSLESRVAILEEKVQKIETLQPIKVIESECLAGLSLCTIEKKSGIYGFWFNYSHRLKQNVAYIFSNGTASKLTSEVIKSVNTYPSGGYFENKLDAEQACSKSVDNLKSFVPACK